MFLNYSLYEIASGEKVLKDLRNGFVSIEKAKEDYEVVMDPIILEVNSEEANKRRRLK
jgi:hypothetical protein